MPLLNAQTLYDQHAFENALSIPDVIDTNKRKTVTLQVQEFDQFLGLYDENGQPLYTTVWGYGTGASGNNLSYPGPTIVAYEGQPITVNWQNKLPVDGHLLPVDISIHLAEPERRPLEAGFIPIVTHLHGGHNRSAYDGLPDQWFTQNGGGSGGKGPREVGPKFVSSSMTYDNDQEGATLWYHDHTLGMTRLNVYAGLAGFYVLQDENRLNLVNTGVLPGGSYDIGLAIQDRAFTADGQLYYPAYKNDVLPGQFQEDGTTPMTVGDMVPQAFYDANGEDAPSVVPEFFGDTIMVNGMAWPNLDVAKGEYQFRLLNGSDSRFYVLKVSDPDVAVHLVGTDGGLLEQAVTVIDGDGDQESSEFIVIAPGDRVDLVFDFSRLQDGETVRLQNAGPAFEPFKGLTDDGILIDATAASSEDPVGNIMQFKVDATLTPLDATFNNDPSTPVTLNPDFVDWTIDEYTNGTNTQGADRIADIASDVRKVGLFEGADQYGRVTPMLGKAEEGSIITDKMSSGDFGPLMWDAPVTEAPLLNSTEQWEVFNFTADSHPIHLHLVQYQVVEKRKIAFEDSNEDGTPDDTNSDGQITYGMGSIPDYAQADIWIGDAVTLRPEETGWHDTVHVNPNEMMSIVAKFDKPGDYVWHCHILSHEDNEMMRPFTVTSNPDAIL